MSEEIKQQQEENTSMKDKEIQTLLEHIDIIKAQLQQASSTAQTFAKALKAFKPVFTKDEENKGMDTITFRPLTKEDEGFELIKSIYDLK